MGTATRFWNWHAERYARQAIKDEASYRKKLAITQKLFTPETRAVEFGCGTGSTALEHAPHVKSYHGIDIAENMVAIARRKAAEAGIANLGFEAGTLESAALPDESYEAVLALNILHLVPDLDATLASVARITTPGGWFVSSSVCTKQLGGTLGRIARVVSWVPGLPSVTPLSVTELEERIEAHGFEIRERFEQAPGVIFLVAQKR